MDAAVRARLEGLLGGPVRTARSIGFQHGVSHYQLELGTDRTVFAKVSAVRVDHAMAAEASGLRWLAAAGAVPVPDVLGWDDDTLAIGWITQESPGRRAALRFGGELAALHAAGADGFGASWPGVIAGLPLPNQVPAHEAAGTGWAEWYAAARLMPYVRIARDAGTFTAADAGLVESAAARAAAVAGPAEPPSRIHGDCWSGNVLWSGGRGWLIDPAAHGGHRESDLAMLALFGAPYLDQIMAAYQEVAPLADGWRARVPLHQLHPLLVHVCLFGAAYTPPALAAARAVLAM